MYADVPNVHFDSSLFVCHLWPGISDCSGRFNFTIESESRGHGDCNVDPGAVGASILRPTAITLQTLILREIGSAPVLIETPMTKTGRIWKATFPIRENDSRFLLYQFVDGYLKDDNGELGWGSFVYGPDRKTLKGGHYWKGVALAFGGNSGIKYRKDLQAARSEIDQERKMFPDNYSAVNLAWYLELMPVETEAAKAHIRRELKEALGNFRKTEDALPMLICWYDRAG